MESMKQKIIDLRSQMDEIKDEIDGNEELGRKVTKVVEQKASAAEFSKYHLFTDELNKIIGLLLVLTQRMHRYEMMLNDLDMSEEADRQQRVRTFLLTTGLIFQAWKVMEFKCGSWKMMLIVKNKLGSFLFLQ